jgi:hypothetical protein
VLDARGDERRVALAQLDALALDLEDSVFL